MVQSDDANVQSDDAKTVTIADIEVYRGPDAVNLYASTARVLASPFEFVISLGQIEPSVSPMVMPRLRELGAVYLSPTHAKSLAHILIRKVMEYESEYGVIPMPPDEDDVVSASTQPEQPSSQSRSARRKKASQP